MGWLSWLLWERDPVYKMVKYAGERNRHEEYVAEQERQDRLRADEAAQRPPADPGPTFGGPPPRS